MKVVSISVVVGIVLLSLIAAFQPIDVCKAEGTLICVNSDGGADYTKIQDAIDAANESDTIYVYSGTYAENIVITTPLTLLGEHRDTTVISGTAINQDTVTIEGEYSTYVSDVSLSGFTIEQNPTAKANLNSVVYVTYTTDYELSNCLITGGNAGILTIRASEGIISENTIEGNTFGLWITTTSIDNEIVNNEIIDNSNKGLCIQESSTGNSISYNVFENNGQHAYDSCTNYWDDGSEGNYWDDYTGSDNDEDGRGDTPYAIAGGSNQDRYPLGYFQGQPTQNKKPTADAGGPYSGETNTHMTFDGSGSSDSDGTIIGYRWDWENDGTYDIGWSSSPTATHTYTSAGTKTVKVQVKDNDGATDTDTALVTITEGDSKPTAAIITINPRETTYGTTIFLYGIAKNHQGTNISYHWRSSINGTLSTEQRFNTASLRVGTHTIYFKVQDDRGWSDEDAATVIITPDPSMPNQAPVADAGGPYTGYVNEQISFDASASYDPDGDSLNYSWDFGDGGTAYGKIVTHIYQSNGTYAITLTVHDSPGKNTTSITSASISLSQSNQNGDGQESTPGFEFVVVILAVMCTLLKKIKKKRTS